VDLVRRVHADGVIFPVLKFCDPHQFDLPGLRAALKDIGVPGIVLEIEDTLPAGGQMRTRCEAFMEML
jgi:benzoyl-CoA reductase/2-hydroxyglutaryl-CoA dehydratase subunit BcrC/BadD/HgdB